MRVDSRMVSCGPPWAPRWAWLDRKQAPFRAACRSGRAPLEGNGLQMPSRFLSTRKTATKSQANPAPCRWRPESYSAVATAAARRVSARLRSCQPREDGFHGLRMIRGGKIRPEVPKSGVQECSSGEAGAAPASGPHRPPRLARAPLCRCPRPPPRPRTAPRTRSARAARPPWTRTRRSGSAPEGSWSSTTATSWRALPRRGEARLRALRERLQGGGPERGGHEGGPQDLQEPVRHHGPRGGPAPGDGARVPVWVALRDTPCRRSGPETSTPSPAAAAAAAAAPPPAPAAAAAHGQGRGAPPPGAAPAPPPSWTPQGSTCGSRWR